MKEQLLNTLTTALIAAIQVNDVSLIDALSAAYQRVASSQNY